MNIERPLPSHWACLSAFVADQLGLHFPHERYADLQRGFAGVARDFGFDDMAACIDCMLCDEPSPAHLQSLAKHLTVGETYFFRDSAALTVFAQQILPGLIARERQAGRRLRLWCAGCCSGEEAYTLAILVQQALPDLADWDVQITATDINEAFLHKARIGAYSEWSFREAPPWLKQRYFTQGVDGQYQLAPSIKRMVHFAHHNLVQNDGPSPVWNAQAMDVIFCRNVLMYFTPPQVHRVTQKLRQSLADGGWLVVSPSEACAAWFPGLAVVNEPGAILFQKRPAPPATPPTDTIFTPAAVHDEPGLVHEAPPPPLRPNALTEAANELPSTLAMQARELANQGRLAQALACCDRWLAADKFNASGHYLHANVLLEQGNTAPARRALERAIFLQPDFVLAHYALGQLTQGQGKMHEANRHFGNALHLLQTIEPQDLLPESDGLSAARLRQTILARRVREKP